jgi:hypothetical protein
METVVAGSPAENQVLSRWSRLAICETWVLTPALKSS